VFCKFSLICAKKKCNCAILTTYRSVDTTIVVLDEIVSDVSFHFDTAHMLKTILLAPLVFIDVFLSAQNFSYTQYGIKDGLAGSNVYAATQDKEGFMWFATETGVSRFDGVHFKNFTIEDGLPDNEILNLFCDSKGRLWMMPFRKTICYYYKGKLYTQKNDPILKRFQISGNIFGMAEDKHGNLALIEVYGVHLMIDTTIKKIPSQDIDEYFSAIATNEAGVINILSSKGIFSVSGQKLSGPAKEVVARNLGQTFMASTFLVRERDKNISLIFYSNGQNHTIGISPVHLNFSILPGNFFSDNTHDGTFIYNATDLSKKEHHLPSRTIANVFRDNENNLWFCTQREGVYKLNSPFVSNKIFTSNNGKVLSVHSLLKYKNDLWVGTEEGRLFTLTQTNRKIEMKTATASYNQIKVLLETSKKDLLIGMQNRITSLFSGTADPDGSVKDIRPAFGNYVLVSTSSGTWIVDATDLNKVDTNVPEAIWKGRTTTAHYSKDTFYIGTLDGLYKVKNGWNKFAGDENPLLKSRIASIRETKDSTLWIATYDQGIIAYKNNHVILNISKAQGLSSNI